MAGYGNAEKVQVQHMVWTILKLSSTPQADAADALAIAITHADILQSLVAMNYKELGIHGMSHSHYR